MKLSASVARRRIDPRLATLRRGCHDDAETETGECDRSGGRLIGGAVGGGVEKGGSKEREKQADRYRQADRQTVLMRGLASDGNILLHCAW